MKALVVDDEPLARRRLVRMLAKLPGVTIAGEAGDGVEALELLARDRPDVILLDIQMPGLDGLELARITPDLPPIVFTTAFDEHAVQAFEVCAVDYLLKPVRLERLRAALAKVAQSRPGADALRELLARLAPPDVPPIAARSGGAVRLFDPRAISRFRAQDKYCTFQHEGREYLLDDSLATLEARLGPLGFARVHRAELVNLKHVRALHARDDAAWVELADGQTAPVSRRLAPELRRRLGL